MILTPGIDPAATRGAAFTEGYEHLGHRRLLHRLGLRRPTQPSLVQRAERGPGRVVERERAHGVALSRVRHLRDELDESRSCSAGRNTSRRSRRRPFNLDRPDARRRAIRDRAGRVREADDHGGARSPSACTSQGIAVFEGRLGPWPSRRPDTAGSARAHRDGRGRHSERSGRAPQSAGLRLERRRRRSAERIVRGRSSDPAAAGASGGIDPIRHRADGESDRGTPGRTTCARVTSCRSPLRRSHHHLLRAPSRHPLRFDRRSRAPRCWRHHPSPRRRRPQRSRPTHPLWSRRRQRCHQRSSRSKRRLRFGSRQPKSRSRW